MGCRSILSRGRTRPGRGAGRRGVAACALFAGGLTLACGEPSATLTIQLQALPELTREQTITVQGTVSRSPTKETVTVVSIAGGSNTVQDSLSSPGAFSIDVTLLANQESQLAITASDAQGSVSEAVVVSILHDNVGPQIAQMSPPSRAENVALDVPIEVEFAEPLLGQTGASVQLLHNGGTVPGVVSISNDSLRVSFTPTGALDPASVYQLAFSGFTDKTGNPVSVDTQACFLTQIGSLVTQLEQDVGDGSWVQGMPEANLTRTDMSRIRFSRLDSTMYTLVEFTNERTFGDDGDDNSILYLEIDADQNSQTGFTTLKDTIFTTFPELESGIGADWFIGVERVPELGDSSYVGILTSALEFDIVETFTVGICGRFWGFHHTAFLSANGDDGLFDYTGIAFTIGENGNLLDVIPESGFNTVNLTGLQPPGVAAYRDNLVRPRGPRRSGGVLDRYLNLVRRGGRE